MICSPCVSTCSLSPTLPSGFHILSVYNNNKKKQVSKEHLNNKYLDKIKLK